MIFKSAIPFFLLLLLTSFVKANVIIGLDEVLNDTTLSNSVLKSQEILSKHPLLYENTEVFIQSPKIRISENRTRAFLFALGLLFSFAILKLAFNRYFSNLWMVFTTLHTSKRHMKEQLENDNRASIWFYILFCATLAFLLFSLLQSKSVLSFTKQAYVQYLICFIAVFILVMARAILLSLLSWIYESSGSVKAYLFSNKLTYEFIGVILFPICVLLIVGTQSMQKPLWWLAVILCGFLMLYDYVRNFSILRNLFRGNFIHFLLYLCAFEILPVLILIRYTQ